LYVRELAGSCSTSPVQRIFLPPLFVLIFFLTVLRFGLTLLEVPTSSYRPAPSCAVDASFWEFLRGSSIGIVMISFSFRLGPFRRELVAVPQLSLVPVLGFWLALLPKAFDASLAPCGWAVMRFASFCSR